MIATRATKIPNTKSGAGQAVFGVSCVPRTAIASNAPWRKAGGMSASIKARPDVLTIAMAVSR
jgi:hypothetical protein